MRRPAAPVRTPCACAQVRGPTHNRDCGGRLTEPRCLGRAAGRLAVSLPRPGRKEKGRHFFRGAGPSGIGNDSHSRLILPDRGREEKGPDILAGVSVAPTREKSQQPVGEQAGEEPYQHVENPVHFLSPAITPLVYHGRRAKQRGPGRRCQAPGPHKERRATLGIVRNRRAGQGSAEAQQEVECPAAADVGAGAAQVGEDGVSD
jgi:hypothetical protein